jgi:hypothetical protein
LGTTGLLIASSLLLLVVVGALVAFDRWPGTAAADTETVRIAGAVSQRDGAGPVRAIDRTSATRLAGGVAARSVAIRTPPRAAARAAALQVAAGSDSLVEAPAPADPVVSDLPAPQSVPAGGPAPASPQPASPDPAPPAEPGVPLADVVEVLPEPPSGGTGDQVTEVTDPVADSVAPLSPALGGTVERTTGTLGGLVDLADGR